MLITLLDELERCLDPITPEVLAALENLGLAHAEGKHWLAMSKSLTRRLKDLAGLGERARGAYTRTSWDHDAARTARAQVAAYVVVEPPGSVSRIEAGPPWRCFVDLLYFKDSERVQRARLVGEDMRDAYLYGRFAEAYRRRLQKGSRFVLQPVPGGGANTHRVFDDQARRGPTICVVDQDPKSPPQERTADKVLARLPRLREDGHVAEVVVLRCHELENLIPEPLVLAAAPEGQRRQHAEAHRGRFGLGDLEDLKELVGRDLLRWVEEFVQNVSDQKLAETYFAGTWLPELREHCEALWSWGLAPPEGKQRV